MPSFLEFSDPERLPTPEMLNLAEAIYSVEPFDIVMAELPADRWLTEQERAEGLERVARMRRHIEQRRRAAAGESDGAS